MVHLRKLRLEIELKSIPARHTTRYAPARGLFLFEVDTLGIEKLIWDLIELGKTVRLKFFN